MANLISCEGDGVPMYDETEENLINANFLNAKLICVHCVGEFHEEPFIRLSFDNGKCLVISAYSDGFMPNMSIEAELC